MTPEAEGQVRAAVAALAEALIAALRAEAAQATAGPDRLLSIDQAAEALGIGRSRLYDELAAGRLRSVKLGRRRLVPSSAIEVYITEKAGPDRISGPAREARRARAERSTAS